MLQHELLEDQGLLILTPQGKLSEADFAAVTRVVDPYIERAGGLRGLMVDAPAFPGWDSLAALISHLRFVKNHHQKISKLAVVSDSSFAKVAPVIMKHFVHAELREFDSSQRDAALAWLRG